MENNKAILTVNNCAYRVLVRPGWKKGNNITTGVRIDWDWYGNPSASTVHKVFDRFIRDIGRSNAVWNAATDKDEMFFVLKEFLKEAPDKETSPFVHNPATQLLDKSQQLHDQLEKEGYTLVRVEHSIDMQEGTITLKYTKEEK